MARRTTLAVTILLVLALTAIVRGQPPRLDTAVHTWMVEHRNPGLTRWAILVTRTGIGPISYVLAAVAGWLAGFLRGWPRLWIGPLVAMTALLGTQLLRQGIARVIDRPRPPMADWAFNATGPSFPSGHTTTTTTVAALFVLAVIGVQRARQFRMALVVVVTLWALGVGVTRVYLGVHWPTDVLAGWLLGLAFALVAVLTIRSLEAQPERSRA